LDELLAPLSTTVELEVRLASAVRLAPPWPPGVVSVAQSDRRLTALIGTDPRLVPGFLDWLVTRGADARALEVRRATLRDAFLRVTGRELEP
jgi:hypothetical protein